jgi:hypothetical protein
VGASADAVFAGVVAAGLGRVSWIFGLGSTTQVGREWTV